MSLSKNGRDKSFKPLLNYVLAAGLVLIALWLQNVTKIWVGARFLLFYPTIILCVGLFGAGPSLLATLVALVGTLICYPFEAIIGAQSFVFLITAGLIIWLHWKGRRAEQNLNIREEELRRTFDATSAGIACVDPNTFLYTQANEAYASMLGYQPGELVGRSLREITHPDDVDLTKNYFRALVNREIDEYRGRKRYLRRDGSELWVEIVVNLVSGINGRPDVISAVIQDITERKKLEKELDVKREDLSLAQSVGQIGSWRFDIQTNELKWSDETYRIFGVSPGEPVTEPLFYLHVHPEDRNEVARSWRQTLESKKRNYNQRLRIIVNCEVRWLQERAKIDYDLNGRPIDSIGTVQDVTDIVRAEDAIQKARADAERANLAKDRFLAMVSHELRTPLTTMQLWAQLLAANQVAPEKMQFAVRAIEQNVRAQTHLIDDLLDVSRIISGKLVLSRTPTEINKVIEESVASVEGLALAKDIKIEQRLDFSAGQVSADPVRLKQIIWNLLSNSIKFSDAHSRIYIQSETRDHNCEVKIIDLGKGIDRDLLPKIFDRFVQSESSRFQGGLGLGLSIVRDLVKLHEGTISAFSAGEGQGATFTLTLPPLVLSTSAKVNETATRAPTIESRPDLNGLRVLLVDDSADVREVVIFALQSMGATVTTAECAFDALTVFSAHEYDVVISDISMPGEDGYALMRKIRAKYGFLIPALALTAYASESDARLAFEAGFQMHLPKPVDWLALGKAVAKLVSKGSSAEQASPGA